MLLVMGPFPPRWATRANGPRWAAGGKLAAKPVAEKQLCAELCRASQSIRDNLLQVEHALAALTREGQSRSEAARAAILEAERAHRRARLRAEAAQLCNDPDDVAASRALAAEMDAIRAW